MKLIGPFTQIVTLDNIPLKGSVKDSQLQIIENGGCLVLNDVIVEVGNFKKLLMQHSSAEIEGIKGNYVLLPGFIDCHTHTCFAGSRAMDFAARNSGESYLEIAKKGGGIWNTVLQTRNISNLELTKLTEARVDEFLKQGITTIEIKTGYGLSVKEELRLLKLISELNTKSTVVPTCLAAHLKPKDFEGTDKEYLRDLAINLLPGIKKYTNRIDIFTEKTAFNIEDSSDYLIYAKKMDYDVTVHANQFTSGTVEMALKYEAVSADHLEKMTPEEIKLLAESNTVAVALPGASLGLGEPFAPARKLLNAGAILAIASDYNPGSAPMGDLLTQASILATYEKLTTAEVFSALTFRAAKALNLKNIGQIKSNFKADFQAYKTHDYQEILYHQGKLKPTAVWKNGQRV